MFDRAISSSRGVKVISFERAVLSFHPYLLLATTNKVTRFLLSSQALRQVYFADDIEMKRDQDSKGRNPLGSDPAGHEI